MEYQARRIDTTQRCQVCPYRLSFQFHGPKYLEKYAEEIKQFQENRWKQYMSIVVENASDDKCLITELKSFEEEINSRLEEIRQLAHAKKKSNKTGISGEKILSEVYAYYRLFCKASASFMMDHWVFEKFAEFRPISGKPCQSVLQSYVRQEQATPRSKQIWMRIYNTASLFENATYEYIHPELHTLKPEWLHPDFRELYVASKSSDNQKKNIELAVKTLQTKVGKEAPLCWSIPIFSVEFCDMLISEIRNYSNFVQSAALDFVGVVLDELKLSQTLRSAVEIFALYLNTAGIARNANVEFHRSSVVFYNAASKVRGHPEHFDDTDLTLNIGLSAGYSGGELCVVVPKKWQEDAYQLIQPAKRTLKRGDSLGVNVHVHRPKIVEEPILSTPYYQIDFKKRGLALCHPGRCVHASQPTTQGSRYNLLLWVNVSQTFYLWEKLPLELQKMIILWLPARDVASIGQTCKRLHTVVEDDSMWERMYRNIFELSPEEQKLKDEAIAWHNAEAQRQSQPHGGFFRGDFGVYNVSQTLQGTEWKKRYNTEVRKALLLEKKDNTFVGDQLVKLMPMMMKSIQPITQMQVSDVRPARAEFALTLERYRKAQACERCFVQ